MIEKKKENYPKNAFGQNKKKEETWVKPGLAVISVRTTGPSCSNETNMLR